MEIVPYGCDVKKVECSNHAVKCYRTRLENIYKDNPSFRGKGGLTKAIIKRRNGPRHCFGDHSLCRSSFCKHVKQTSSHSGKFV